MKSGLLKMIALIRISRVLLEISSIVFRSQSNYSGSGFRSGSSRTSSVPASVKKNDQRIVYRNPIKVDKPVVSGGVPAANSVHDDNPYHPGARVHHVKFGVGTILRCSGSGDEARVEIRFSRDGSTRTLVAKYVKIVD